MRPVGVRAAKSPGQKTWAFSAPGPGALGVTRSCGLPQGYGSLALTSLPPGVALVDDVRPTATPDQHRPVLGLQGLQRTPNLHHRLLRTTSSTAVDPLAFRRGSPPAWAPWPDIRRSTRPRVLVRDAARPILKAPLMLAPSGPTRCLAGGAGSAWSGAVDRRRRGRRRGVSTVPVASYSCQPLADDVPLDPRGGRTSSTGARMSGPVHLRSGSMREPDGVRRPGGRG